MIPDFPYVYCCPCCEHYLVHWRQGDSRLEGRRATDGEGVVRFLWPMSGFKKCPTCGGCFWLEETQRVARLGFEGHLFPVEQGAKLAADLQRLPVDGVRFPALTDPEELDYYFALNEGRSLSAERERELRIRAWWKSNRESGVRGWDKPEICLFAYPQERQTSLSRLVELLDSQVPEEALVKADALRQLGRFYEAGLILKLLRRLRCFDEEVLLIDSLRAEEDTMPRHIRLDQEQRHTLQRERWRNHQMDHIKLLDQLADRLGVNRQAFRWCGDCVHRHSSGCRLGYQVARLLNSPEGGSEAEGLSKRLLDIDFVEGQKLLSSQALQTYWLHRLEKLQRDWQLPCSHTADEADCEPGFCQVLESPEFMPPGYEAARHFHLDPRRGKCPRCRQPTATDLALMCVVCGYRWFRCPSCGEDWKRGTFSCSHCHYDLFSFDRPD